MAALLPSLARTDTTIAFPRLQRTPTIDEYLAAPNKGDKARIQAVFALQLTACASSKTAKNLNKYRDVLATPMRDEITKFCNIGAASEIFTISLVYEMSLSQCFEYWRSWFKGINDFTHGLLGDIAPRHFDTVVWEALASMSPRDQDGMRPRFWPEKGLECAECPYANLKRDPTLLPGVTNQQYLEFYQRACQERNLGFDLPSKRSLIKFSKLHVPAVRAVSAQVLRWLVPAPEDAQLRTGNRYSARQEMQGILVRNFFDPEGFVDPPLCASVFMKYVIESVFAEVTSFAPKSRPDYENYPTIVVQDTTSTKENIIDEVGYMVRFRESWAWAALAKSVAYLTRCKLKQSFMRVFNNPDHQVSCCILSYDAIEADQLALQNSTVENRLRCCPRCNFSNGT